LFSPSETHCIETHSRKLAGEVGFEGVVVRALQDFGDGQVGVAAVLLKVVLRALHSLALLSSGGAFANPGEHFIACVEDEHILGLEHATLVLALHCGDNLSESQRT